MKIERRGPGKRSYKREDDLLLHHVFIPLGPVTLASDRGGPCGAVAAGTEIRF